MSTPDPYLREEYTARINRVIDYIEQHLDQKLSLEVLARVASFSPFHFHRIFKALTGETLNQFMQRVRLEKAATQLIYQPKKSITAISLDCGFTSSATFARAFRDVFEMSATEWRNGGYHAFSKNRKMDSNNDQSLRNPEQTWDSSFIYLARESFKQKWSIMINQIQTQIEVKDLPETHIAYIRHVGAYQGDEALFTTIFGKLMKWAGPRGLLRFPETKTLTVYHDNPGITETDKQRISVGLTVPEDTAAEGEIGRMSLPAGKYAVAHFEIDTHEFEAAWSAVYGSWLPESGYQPADSPCFELYHNDPNQHPEGKHILDICVPVMPM